MSPAEKVIEFRRALHQIPEVGLDLPMTRAYLWLRLTGLGLKPVECAEGLYVDLGTEGPLFAWRIWMLSRSKKNWFQISFREPPGKCMPVAMMPTWPLLWGSPSITPPMVTFSPVGFGSFSSPERKVIGVRRG